MLENKNLNPVGDSAESNKKYDLIFLDCYISRYNEVVFLSNYLKAGGIFVVSNIREEIAKSLLAKNFLLDTNNFELLEIADDTIFCKKKANVL